MSVGSKVLITGLSNAGKTTLLKPLKNVLVVSRDGKPFSLELPHVNVGEYSRIDELLDIVQSKLDAYKERFNEYPDTIVFDSVSRIFTDIETSCSKRFDGFKIWDAINKEINTFVEAISDLQSNGFNVVLIAHAVWDEKAGKYVETCKGSFQKIGGWLSTVDYALNIDTIGSKRIVTHRGNSLSRTLLEGIPDKEDANTFNLQEYLDKIHSKANVVTEKWSI